MRNMASLNIRWFEPNPPSTTTQSPTLILNRQTFNTASTRALLQSMKLPYTIDDHDLQIEYYFRDVSSLLAVSADEGFKELHVEAIPYVRLDNTTVALTWVEVYLEDGKLVNIGADGKSLQPSFAEQSDIQVSDKPADKYY